MDLSQITFIGKTDFRNQMSQFGIRAKDRFRHMYIIGKSGTGKTTLLENMIVQDIYNGNGIAFIDPHGESADKLLNYIPTERMNDVIYFNPGDSAYPVAFNPMEIEPGAPAHVRSLIADGLMTVFKKIWPEAFSGRMEYILNNTMLALLEYPEPTLLGINRMLTDKDYRKKVIASVTDPTVRNAWDELMKWDDKRWSEAISALVNKVGQFTTNPIVRNIIGQPVSTFNFRQVMDEKKILIMNMSKGLIGEQSAALLGAMLITKIYLASMSRANLTPEELLNVPPLYFYVDEFQNFANDSFANILSEARKYKLALTVANQYIAQMEETIRDAVFGNMGTTITFRVGPLDAEFIERVYTPVFNAQDLQNIAFGQVFMTLLIDGMSSKPFSALTLPPIQPRETPDRNRVIETSRAQYARNQSQVETKVMQWFNDQRVPPKKPEQKSSTTFIKPSVSTNSSDTVITRDEQAISTPIKTVPSFMDDDRVQKITTEQTESFGLDDLFISEPKSETTLSVITKPVIPETKIVQPQSEQKIQQKNNQSFTKTNFQTNPKKQPWKKPVQQNISQKPSVHKPEHLTQQSVKSATHISIHNSKPTTIKPNFSKAAKTDTKNALSELLKKVVAEKPIVQKVQPQPDLSNVLQQFTVSTSEIIKTKPLEQVKTTRERLEQIFNTSHNHRGDDDLPERVPKQNPVIREVPADVLERVFHS